MNVKMLITVWLFCGSAEPAFSGDPVAVPKVLNGVLAGLQANEFSTRIAAAKQLSELSTAELGVLANLPASELVPEAATRVLHELEKRYVDESNEQEARMASKFIEDLASSARLMLADGARRVLEKHWRRRVAIVRGELEDLGAKFRDGTFSSEDNMRWLPGADMPTLQILLGEEWQGGNEGLRKLERMAALTDPQLRMTGLYAWVLEGHKLTEADFSTLNELVGQNRIYLRSRVALGISGWGNVGPGVLIKSVSRGGSADAAGLRERDFIVSIVEPVPDGISEVEKQKRLEAQKLQDFDDLVERLKKYREGDVIKLQVVRGLFGGNQFAPRVPPQGQRGPAEIVDVKLKGWMDLPANPN